MTPNNNKKRLWLAYLFLLFGGFFGLHQFYLGRYRHGFALCASFGGYFGVGLIREFWRLPEYVAEVNGDHDYMVKLIEKMRQKSKPSFGIVRYFASIVVADILGYLVMGAIPHEWFSVDDTSDNIISRLLNSILVPVAIAIGVHTVGNIGHYCGPIRWPLIAAYMTAPLYFFNLNPVFITSLLATLAFTRYSLQWRRTPQKSISKWLVTLAMFAYLMLWISWFCFNCTVTDKNDEIIKCRVAVGNFFNSPAWLEFRMVLRNLWDFIQIKGISGLWNEIVEALDPQGEKNALRILGLNESSTQDDITAMYRKLARQWHPDKNRIGDERLAQEKFMAIQQAYDLLSSMRQKRLRKQSS